MTLLDVVNFRPLDAKEGKGVLMLTDDDLKLCVEMKSYFLIFTFIFY